MNTKSLARKVVAALVTDGFEEIELISPMDAISRAGGDCHIVSPKAEFVLGWTGDQWGEEFGIDVHLPKAEPESYDALLLPGGVLNPDSLRTDEDAIAFVKHFFEEGKPVAAICHGLWTLINAGVVRGRTVTSVESVRIDLENAGATWKDEEVIVDNGLVTSRTPDDLRAFNEKLVQVFAAGMLAPNENSRGSAFAAGAG